MASYYVMRPLRESLAVAAGTKSLPRFYLGTFLGIVAAVPVWSWLAGRLPRRALLQWTYRFFALNVLGFWLVFSVRIGHGDVVFLGGIFFAWVSGMIFVAVSAFWSGLVDVFGPDEGKRLFPFIAGGGSLGALVGSVLTYGLVGLLGPIHLLLLPAVLLLASAHCFSRLEPVGGSKEHLEELARPPKGNLKTAVLTLLKSKFLLGIALYQILLSHTAAFTYSAQTEIVGLANLGRDGEARYFAAIDFAVQIAAFAAQTFGTRWIIRRFGLKVALSVLPLTTLLAFSVLGLAPTLASLAVVEILRRMSEYGIASPSRQVLYTVASRNVKYRTKNVVDTFVFRLSDVVASNLVLGLQNLSLSLPGRLLCGLPLPILWVGLALALARGHELQMKTSTPATQDPEAPATKSA